jgi:hypothetical protein
MGIVFHTISVVFWNDGLRQRFDTDFLTGYGAMVLELDCDRIKEEKARLYFSYFTPYVEYPPVTLFSSRFL